MAPCLTGCFTTVARMNHGMSAGTTEVSIVPAVVLDVVTSPIQAPFLVGIAASNPSLMSGNAKGMSTAPPTQTQATPQQLVKPRVQQLPPLEEIRKDPEYLFSHGSSLSRDTIQQAILDKTIPFTAEQLRKLGETNEWTRIYVAANPRCPRDTLEGVWKGLAQMSEYDRQRAAHYLIMNPNTPDACLEDMAEHPEIFKGISGIARGLLYRRNVMPSASGIPPAPTTTSPSK